MAMPLKVMTFNMRLATTHDAERHGVDCQWAARRQAFIGIILREKPDFLGVQEAMPEQVHDLTRALTQHGYCCDGQSREGPDAPGEGMFIAVREPYQIASKGCFWLAVDTPFVPGSKASGAPHPRIAHWAKVESAEQQLVFVNTHFDNPTKDVNEANRVRSAEEVCHFLQHEFVDLPAIVVLDSNGEPNAPAHSKFIELGLIDSWAECHPDQTLDRPPTFHNFEGPQFRVPSSWALPQNCDPGTLGTDGRKTCHIDWILHNNLISADSCEIDYTESPPGQAPPSDHFAVIATLSVRQAKRKLDAAE